MRASGGVSPAVRAVLVTAAASLMMVLVAWATLIGPDAVFTGPGTIERTFTPRVETCIPVPTPDADGSVQTPDNPDRLPYCEEPVESDDGVPDPAAQATTPLWLKVLVWVFVFTGAAVFLAVLVVLLRLARDRVRPRRRRVAQDEIAFATLDGPTRLAQEIVSGAADQDAVLRDGDARNAIVAAWLRFEVQGGAAGVGRERWETSSEYALRILDLVSADPAATHRLAALFREARFSDHPLTEEHRAEALDALAAIRRSLGVRT